MFPLWVCGNAMSLEKDCVYVECNRCYVHPTGRPSRAKKQKKNKNVCDYHPDNKKKNNDDKKKYDDKKLERFDDESYYRGSYYDKMIDEDNFPKRLPLCKEYSFVMI